MFKGRVPPVLEDVMFKWLLVEEGRKARHTFSQPDLIIAAMALFHGLSIVSRWAIMRGRGLLWSIPWKEAGVV